MFNTHFGFTATPFSKSIRTSDVLQTPPLKELAARLSVVMRERGIAVVTGDVGSGKSTAVRAFLASLDPNRHVILQLSAPLSTPAALYRSLLFALNQQPPFGATAQIAALRQAFNELQDKRMLPLIVMDEAHLLAPALIDPLRTLLAAHLDSHSLAALILIGQSDLRRMLLMHPLQAFAQRITARAHLEPLALEHTLAYLAHHLKLAGANSDLLFADDAKQRIADFALGIPRRINQIATAALIAAAADKKRIVDDAAVRRALNDLEQA
jgi:general secretion pathway protein A